MTAVQTSVARSKTGNPPSRSRSRNLRRPGLGADGFLADPRVRRRWTEFLGGTSLQDASCVYVAPPAPTMSRPFSPLAPADLPQLIHRNGEAARSLWDRRDLIADLDVEHVHFDRPRESLRDRERSWRIRQPVVAAIQGILHELGLETLHFLTGRGHHWLWRIPRSGTVYRDLAFLGTLTPGLQARYTDPVEGVGEAVGLGLGAAYHGLGKVMEYLGHQVLARAAGTPVPVRLTAVSVPPGPSGREIVSVDLSLFGDPVDRRAVRLPFTPYLKWWQPGSEPIVALPVPAGHDREAFEAMTDLAAAADWAGHASARIPSGERGTSELFQRYLASELAQEHRAFYGVQPDPEWRWPETYDRLEPGSLPPCVARILEQPNDLVLQPASIELLTRTLLALGWVPRHVAGLLRSKLEREHHWIPELHFHEPSCRADFYVRLFTGLALASPGLHGELDCSSTRGQGLCPVEGTDGQCPWSLGRLPALSHAGVVGPRGEAP